MDHGNIEEMLRRGAEQAKLEAEMADLDNRFTYHPPTTDRTKARHEQVRATCHDAANILIAFVPDGREKALMLTKLEEAMFWANAGIARKEA